MLRPAAKRFHSLHAPPGASVGLMDPIERIYREWDACNARHDVEGIVALYAADATFESPLVRRLMERDAGVLRGRAELREFFGGEQTEFAEVMEIEDGLIRRHRVYWGWVGFRNLEKQ